MVGQRIQQTAETCFGAKFSPLMFIRLRRKITQRKSTGNAWNKDLP